MTPFMLMTSEFLHATVEEREAGARLDAVGHIITSGDHMTCMCCGAETRVDAEGSTGPFDFDGSQWVRTPRWVRNLRGRSRAARTLSCLASGMEPAGELLRILDEREECIHHVDFGPGATTFEKRVQVMLDTVTGKIPSKDITDELP